MQEFVSLNSGIVKAADARVSALTNNAFYGRGVWTTIAIFKRKPFLWTNHFARLTDHARRVGVKLDIWTEEQTRGALLELINHNRIEEGRARVMFLACEGFTERGSRAPSLWSFERTSKTTNSKDSSVKDSFVKDSSVETSSVTDLLMVTAARGANKSSANDNQNDSSSSQRFVSNAPLALTVSPYRVNTLSPLTGLKTTNYLDHILAWQEARAREFDEAVRLNERGEITGATLANLFWVKDGTLYTPALSTGTLAGITRACVLRLAERLNIPTLEVAHDLTHLSEAEEIFLTSAGRMIGFVAAYDFHRYTITAGSVAAQLSEALRQELNEL